MTTSEDPWAGVHASLARRVDPKARHDVFWMRVESNACALGIKVLSDEEGAQPLPRIRSLDIRFRDFESGRYLVLALREPEQADIFATLCRDVAAAVEPVTDPAAMLSVAIRRTMRWHHLLRGGDSKRLGPEEQRGLIAELHFLAELCERIGPRGAIEAWRGPEGAAKDFELPEVCVEVKARRGAARPHVQISSEDQLSDVDACALFLRVHDVDAAARGATGTLTNQVRVVDAIFQRADPEAHLMWEAAIAATGYDEAHDYSDRTWKVGRIVTFRVADGFPRIAAPAPAGVTRVKYQIGLEECREFVVDEDTFFSAVEGGFAHV